MPAIFLSACFDINCWRLLFIKFTCECPYSFLYFRCYLQKRVLNLSKGPAVRALRAQTDKREYAMHMRGIVERQVYLDNYNYYFLLFKVDGASLGASYCANLLGAIRLKNNII